MTGELSFLGAQTLIDWLEHPTPPVCQPADGATYASKIDKAEARLDWTRTAEELERQARAFNPVPGAWFEANGERIKLLGGEVREASGSPGQVLDDDLTVATGLGAIHPVLVQRAGRGPMTVDRLLRGFAIPRGVILP